MYFIFSAAQRSQFILCIWCKRRVDWGFIAGRRHRHYGCSDYADRRDASCLSVRPTKRSFSLSITSANAYQTLSVPTSHTKYSEITVHGSRNSSHYSDYATGWTADKPGFDSR